MSVPYFPLFPDDFEADTAHLTMAEDGAYNRLLRLQWRSPGCSLPDDLDWICRKVRARDDADRAMVSAVIDEYFTREDGRIFSRRLSREFVKATETFEKRSEAGSKGGKSRSLISNDICSSRAKAGLKQPEPEPEPEEREEAKASLSSGDDVQPIDEITIAVSAYNATAASAGWPRIQVLSKQRRANLKARLAECGGIDGWVAALTKAKASPHCCGQNDRGWVANFDFLTRQSSFAKLMEGNYDARQSPQHNRQLSRADATSLAIAVAGATRRAPEPDWL